MTAFEVTSIAAAALLVVGCAATTETTTANTRPIPANELKAYGSPARETGAVLIFRDEGFAGSLARYELLVDGAPITTIGTGERVELYLPQGERFLEVRPPSYLGIPAPGDSLAVTIVVGQRHYFRITSGRATINLSRVAPATVGEE